MSYYCKGEICPLAKKCLRVEAWKMLWNLWLNNKAYEINK